MTADELYGHLESILVDELGVDPTSVRPEATYVALGLDSLDVIEMVLIVEENHRIRVEDEELQTIQTLRELAELLAARSGGHT